MITAKQVLIELKKRVESGAIFGEDVLCINIESAQMWLKDWLSNGGEGDVSDCVDFIEDEILTSDYMGLERLVKSIKDNRDRNLLYKDLKIMITLMRDSQHDEEPREVLFAVPVDWLKEQLEDYAEDDNWDLDEWLESEYTGEDSEPIFSQALLENKIVMIDFN
jgi:hypothetical protein